MLMLGRFRSCGSPRMASSTVVNLQQCLLILGLRPVQQSAAAYLLDACQLLLRALEALLLHDGLGDLCGKMACLEIRKCGAKNSIRRVKPAQNTGGQTRSQAGREAQRKPGEGSVRLHRLSSLCAE